MTRPSELAGQHVAAFNDAVQAGDFTAFLAGFHHDAVLRFENVPSAGVLEFRGRRAFTAAYARQPPDDMIDIAGPVREEEGTLVVPFAWRRDGAAGTLRLTVTKGRVGRMVVIFSGRLPRPGPAPSRDPHP